MSMRDYEYISQLPETEAVARRVKELTLQDKKLGGFEDVMEASLPIPDDEVVDQLEKIVAQPDAYSGYRQANGVIVAFMKAKEWYTGDEAPFVENRFARNAMILAGKLRGDSMEPRAYGVFGLVAADTLELHDMDEILEGLLIRSIGQAAAQSAAFINVVIHEKDPLLPIAQDFHFHPVGPLGRAAGAEGLLQQRYQRPVEL